VRSIDRVTRHRPRAVAINMIAGSVIRSEITTYLSRFHARSDRTALERAREGILACNRSRNLIYSIEESSRERERERERKRERERERKRSTILLRWFFIGKPRERKRERERDDGASGYRQ